MTSIQESPPGLAADSVNTLARVPVQMLPPDMVGAEQLDGSYGNAEVAADQAAHLESLARQVQATGDRRVFWELVEAQYPYLSRVAVGIVSKYGASAPLESEDVVNQALLRVWKSIENAAAEGGRLPIPRLSLFTHTMNTVILDALRKHERALTTCYEPSSPVWGRSDPTETSVEEQALRPATRALAYLAIVRILADIAPDRVPVAIASFQGEPGRRLAAQSGMSHDALKQMVHRVRNRAKRLRERGEIPPADEFA